MFLTRKLKSFTDTKDTLKAIKRQIKEKKIKDYKIYANDLISLKQLDILLKETNNIVILNSNGICVNWSKNQNRFYLQYAKKVFNIELMVINDDRKTITLYRCENK